MSKKEEIIKIETTQFYVENRQISKFHYSVK